MLAKQKNWISGGLWRPKNPHSLEHLKYLYNVLCKNQTVNEQNKSLLVETLRSISEILIWGDQNDSTVFDFFLEKNMLSFFIRFMRQKYGRYICVQLLQTLNILFDNISNETSVYYLLSNNHINAIIVHKFDFSDEEVMAYYISFLKTLSLKLNKHTIHFFYNEHTNDFALYTEAIKFFNHPEGMVRIAVRTITLNVYKACRYTSQLDENGQPVVDDKSMLCYIRDKTAAPYFSNLVWFIGSHVLELDSCVRHDIDHNSKDRLSDLVAEHLDFLHYLNDILCLNIDALNEVLTDHLLNRLLIPLYVYSLTKCQKYAARMDERPHVSSVVSLFLLSQVFLIMHHAPLVRQLAEIIFEGTMSVCMVEAVDSPQAGHTPVRRFGKPDEPLAESLDQNKTRSNPKQRRPNYRNVDEEDHPVTMEGNSTFYANAPGGTTVGVASRVSLAGEGAAASASASQGPPSSPSSPDPSGSNQNSTDEEKLLQTTSTNLEQQQTEFSLNNRPYLEAVFNALECNENDYEALFALCLLYAMGHNDGINQALLDSVLMPTDKSQSKEHYNVALMEKLIRIINRSCQNASRIRLATLELCILLLKTLVYHEGHCFLQDRHLAALEGAREEATLQLRNFYKVWEKSEEIFLDMFEDEYREMQLRPLNVEYLTMDASILLPPTGTPLTGIDFNKRLPCGEVERARRAIRIFFLLRELSMTLRQEEELQLPLTKMEECVRLGDVLDLNNSDLIACTVITKDNRKERRFLVIDILQLILVEPDLRRLGWGVVKFVGFLQDVEVTGDKEDSRSLHITIHKPSTNIHARPEPLLLARFVFDDHIRCMAAKQRLSKGRLKARQRKMQMIARLLELPMHIVESMYTPSAAAPPSAATLRTTVTGSAIPGRSHPVLQRTEAQPPARPQTEIVTSKKSSQAAALRGARQMSKAIPITSSFPGVAARELPPPERAVSPQPRGSQHGEDALAESARGGDEVEVAEEAKPSPEACMLHSPVRLGSEERHESISVEKFAQGIDISHSSRSPRTTSRDISSSSRKAALSDGGRHRSSSCSPHRVSRPAGSAPCSPAVSSQSPSQSPARSYRRRDMRERSSSWSSPDTSSQSDDQSDTGEGCIKPPRGKRTRPTSAENRRRQRHHSPGTSLTDAVPKTLTPANQPAASLVLSCDIRAPQAPVGLGSPKLMPPVDHTRLRRLSDATTATTDSSESGLSTSATSKTCEPGEEPEPLQHDKKPPLVGSPQSPPPPTVGVTTASASHVERVATGQESATDQLTRLAQMVQEHYSVMDTDGHTFEMAPGTTAPIEANVTDDIKKQTFPS